MDMYSNNIFIFSFFLFFHSVVGRRHSIQLFVGHKALLYKWITCHNVSSQTVVMLSYLTLQL